jgi:hypothetical protein
MDWMMHLRDDLSERFEQELIALEESLNMPYVTSVERIWEARGRAVVLVTVARKLFGALPQHIEARIHKLSLDRLEALGEAILGFRSLEELEAWLASQEKPAG